MGKDIMKIESSFARMLASKMLEKEIQKKYGCKVEIRLDKLVLDIDEDSNNVKANISIRAMTSLDNLKGATRVLYENEK